VSKRYTERFKRLASSEKLRLHSEASTALISFRTEIDQRLYPSRRRGSQKAQILFWIAYHAVTISLHRPMLDPSSQGTSHLVEPCLRAATSAAESITQLTSKLRRLFALSEAPPCLATHLLRASLVHAVRAAAFQGRAATLAKSRFWECMQGLAEMKSSWSTLVDYYMRFLVATAEDWGIGCEAALKSTRGGGSMATFEAFMPEMEEMY
jgi:hypothetical protein